MAKYIEEGTNYSYIVKRMKDVNFRSLRNVSVDFTKRLPEDLSNELYKDIQHGVCQLQSEPELNMYIHALGMMHEAKLQHAFEHLAIDFFSHSSIDIIDYGCGQAIGTICYADFLREKGYSQKVRKITLIEPSELALKRAALHVSCFFPNAEIVTILKGFDDLVDDDISVDGDVPALHILSNVIDLADDCFNLEDFTTLIKKNIKGENHFVCIEPYFGYYEENEKLERFIELFDAEVYYRKVFTKGTFVEGREWTCNVAIGGKINKEILCKPKESSFDLKIKQLINNGAKLIKNCKVKNIAYSNNDGKIIVKFVLTEPIRDYVLCADGVNYKIGKTDIIYSSIYAVFEILLEDDTLGWLGNVILENPSVLNEVFQGAIVDVLQQEVFKGEEYINPFIENYKQKTIISDRNFIVNHCVKFYLSEAGEKVADDIMNVIFGYIDDNNIKILMDFANTAQDKNRNKEAFSYYKLAAKANYAEAQYRLGICYYYGNGISQDYLEAVKWYKKASEQGDANAQYNLGFCYEKGFGVEKDEKEAVNWYRKAAEQGHARAQFNLGLCYSKGQGVAKDELEMVEWYRKAAEQGNANAQCNLGFCYKSGSGVEKNEKEAVKWYLKSAEQGEAVAQCNLGICYEYGQGVRKNEDEAIKWYIKAANQGNKIADRKLIGDINSIKNFYDLNDDVREKMNWILKTQFNIDKVRDDVEKLNWFIKVANKGYSKTQNYLGLYYELKKNYKEAVKWFFLAAKEGYVESQYYLGFCYKRGLGVEKDEKEAVKWYLKSAEQGYATAQYSLGMCYDCGQGVMQNEDEAIKWYIKSAKQGYEPARQALIKYDGDIAWLVKLAENEYFEAQYKLGVLYEIGKWDSWCYLGERGRKVFPKIESYHVEQSYEKAIGWYLRAVGNGSVDALFSLGQLYEQGKGIEQSYEEAVKWYKEAVAKGHNGAKYNLAELYVLGKGVDKSIENALDLLKEYIHSGKGEDFYNFGDLFYFGKGVEQSYEEAVIWWKLSAKENYSRAEYMLGVCFEKGHGVEQSYEEAVKWYRKAIEKGNKNAMFNLANCYRYGRGVERSYSNAVKLYKESNTGEAQRALKEISDINNPIVALFKRIKFNLGKLQ